eukprot:CAMPEP_0204843382 /NCGR_PEP_ID=MMETSP1346-20131115/47944_1 /ASSEMBLY_ACC=CAM_ASM_000771 /TAXON_ID=215587 /ORGANISM="Aplanochytrium stocchinoi, Strain GSBS06" /LENGTH=211 /DNA_ID=CAMNT_0051982515 /DNA_START=260 /DNA_END=895 /DNA_ORIENTATION=+
MAPGMFASDEDWTSYMWRHLKEISKKGLENPRTVFDPAWEILPYLFLGDKGHAESIDGLKELGITHVLNCAEGDEAIITGESYYKNKMVYKGIKAKDSIYYDMAQHIEEAAEFINSAKAEGGKVLVHCVKGINRSGMMTIAYCINGNKWELAKAFKYCAEIRLVILTNKSFQIQLVQWARENDLLFQHKRLARLIGSQVKPKKIRDDTLTI